MARRTLPGEIGALAAALCLLLAPAASPAAGPHRAARGGVPEPKIKFDPIPFGHQRKRETANYSHRHYGDRTWRLSDPKAIVLHYTATSTYSPVFNAFASDAPNLGEKPGVCSQFVIDKDGTIHQLTRLYVRCRHTIGLNHVSIGIEMVQEELGSRHGSDEAILDRGAQIRAATHLVAWLKQRYGIAMDDVIGHAMANHSHLFKDLEGWRNDHVDWRSGDVRKFRKRVARVVRGHRAAPARPGEPARIVFGHSVEGTKLVARRIGPASARHTALVVGEVHGDEEAGRAIVKALRRDHRKLRDTAIWTVGTVNPDGHAHDRRTNDHGVDLNRNFPVGWSGAEPQGSGYYAGPHPLSEPESKGFRDLVREVDPDLTILYHQPWGAVLAPCSGPAPLQKRYADIASMPLDRCRGEHLPGTMTRWENSRHGTAFVVELAPGDLSDAQVRRHVRAVRAIATR
jgi:hypothetical protein